MELKLGWISNVNWIFLAWNSEQRNIENVNECIFVRVRMEWCLSKTKSDIV